MGGSRAQDNRIDPVRAPAAPHPWDQEATQLGGALPPAWLRLAADLHGRLLDRWRGRLPEGARVLKTDLFEEALGRHSPLSMIAQAGWRGLGMDIGRRIAVSARMKLAGETAPRLVVTDVRRIGLCAGSVDAVFSNSTLDHFRGRDEIEVALRELHRVLRPGGRLVLTLDNPSNPLVRLRNVLPRALSDRLRLTPYDVGATLSLAGARAALLRVGFDVASEGYFMHVPRVWVIRRLRKLRRIGASPEKQRRTERHALAWEALGRWPTARWTGHFLYVEARKSVCSEGR